jgi:hypothetical protein
VLLVVAATTMTSTTSSHLNAAAGDVLCRTLSRTCRNEIVAYKRHNKEYKRDFGFGEWNERGESSQAITMIATTTAVRNQKKRASPNDALSEGYIPTVMLCRQGLLLSPINPRRAGFSFFRQKPANE